MARIPTLRRGFRAPWRRAAADVDEELAFHLDMRARELVARGWPPAAAEAEARRQFGDLDDARRYCRALTERRENRVLRLERLQDLAHDLALAARGLRRTPGFALAAIVTLALGIGANVTMLGVVDRLLLRAPAQVREPDAVHRLYFSRARDGTDDTDASASYPQYLAVAEAMRSARSVTAYYTREAAIGEGDAAHVADVALVTANFLGTLGVRPALGRDFLPEEDVPPRGSAVAILGDALWRRDFGADPAIVGRTVVISGRRFQVVGVAPRGFTGVDLAATDAWVPLSALAGETIDQFTDEGWHRARNVGFLRLVARVPARSATRATAEATLGWRRHLEARAKGASVDSLHPRASLEPLLLDRGRDRTPAARIAMWLAGMSAVVLCIACANVANLLLARAVRRRRESAVRVALGAARRRLVGQTLTEALLLGALGGAAAVAVAHWGGIAVRRLLLPDAAWSGGPLADPRLLALAAAVAIGSGLLTGLVPALQAGRVDLSDALRSGSRDGGGRRSRARSALVVAQAALSLVLLVGAGLFVRSLRSARAVDLGFAPEHVLSVEASFGGSGYTPAETGRLAEQLRERLARLPGVVSASLGMSEPFSTTLDANVTLPGRDTLVMPASGPPRFNAVSPQFFATMGTRIVRGRGILPEDRRGATPVVVVNETMARTLWPGRDPIGECVILRDTEGKPCLQVVGIAHDARWRDLRAAPPMQMYLSLDQGLVDLPLRVVYLRCTGDPAALVRAVRHEVRQVAPRVLLPDVEPLVLNLEPETRPWRVGAAVFTAFGGLALTLAALGLYAVVAYDAAQRTREMGVRRALGAGAGDVLRLVVGYGVRVAAVGVAVGVGAALLAGRWVGPLLFETTPHDPAVLGGVSLLLLLVAVVAGAVPAWRATRVAPGVALRVE